MIYEQRTYVNENGVTIYRKTPLGHQSVIGGEMTNFHPDIFFAGAVLQFQIPGGQVGQAQFNFEIPATTPEEAFLAHGAAMEAGRIKAESDVRKQVEAQQNKIIIPPNGHSDPRIGRN